MLPTLPPTPHGPIPLSTRNISIQSTAERRHHHLYGCKCTLNADNAHGSAHVRAIQWPALLPAQRIAGRAFALASTVEGSSLTLVDQRHRQILCDVSAARRLLQVVIE